MSKSKRGFASMDPERRRQLASQGGKTGAVRGTSYRWDAESASVAGKLGAQAKKQKQQDEQVVKEIVNDNE